MYDSRPRPVDGEPIEEVLPAAINATATSERAERQSASRELVRRQSGEQEPVMAVMRSGSPMLNVGGLSPIYVLGAVAAVLMLVVFAVILL